MFRLNCIYPNIVIMWVRVFLFITIFLKNVCGIKNDFVLIHTARIPFDYPPFRFRCYYPCDNMDYLLYCSYFYSQSLSYPIIFGVQNMIFKESGPLAINFAHDFANRDNYFDKWTEYKKEEPINPNNLAVIPTPLN